MHSTLDNSRPGRETRFNEEDWGHIATFVSDVNLGISKWLSTSFGLGITEYHTIANLASAPRTELRLNDIASRVGLNQSSVTRLIGRLETKGLVFKDDCPDDGRGVYAALTQHGLETFRKIKSAYSNKIHDEIVRIGSNLTAEEHADLADALHRISTLI